MNISEISKLSSQSVVQVNPNQLEIYADTITLKNLEKGDRTRGAIRTKKELDAYKGAVRESFLRAIGGLPEGRICEARVTNTITIDNLVCEAVVLETLPGFFATANVYKPLNAQGKLPAVLMVCGHSEEGRMAVRYQVVQKSIALAGFVVMGLDPVGQGERISYYEDGLDAPTIPPCTREHDYAGAQCLLAGITITRYFVNDGISALEYLSAREDVDASRIGVTGSSGGGTQTAMLMMCAPEKIAAAAPGTFITDRKAILFSRQAQDLEQIWPGMVSDGFDHADALACMVPKPVMLLTVDSDFFPLEGTHRTIQKATPLWELYEKPENLEIVTDQSQHAYTFMLAKAAADFFSRHLLGCPFSLEGEPSIQNPKILFACDGGSVVKTFGSKLIHDFVLDELNTIDAQNKTLPKELRKHRAADNIRRQVEKYPDYPLYIKRKHSPKHADRFQIYNMYLELYTWFQQEGIHNFGLFFYKIGTAPREVVLALWDGGTTQMHRHLDEVMSLCEQDKGVFVVDLTGTGTVSDGLYKHHEPDYYYTRFVAWCENLMVNGDNLPAMRVRGILRALNAAEDFAGKDTKFEILTHGAFNLYALMARVIDPRIEHITEVNPLKSLRSFAESKYYNHNNIMALAMPGILKDFDLDDLRDFE